MSPASRWGAAWAAVRRVGQPGGHGWIKQKLELGYITNLTYSIFLAGDTWWVFDDICRYSYSEFVPLVFSQQIKTDAVDDYPIHGWTRRLRTNKKLSGWKFKVPSDHLYQSQTIQVVTFWILLISLDAPEIELPGEKSSELVKIWKNGRKPVKNSNQEVASSFIETPVDSCLWHSNLEKMWAMTPTLGMSACSSLSWVVLSSYRCLVNNVCATVKTMWVFLDGHPSHLTPIDVWTKKYQKATD